MKSFSSKRVLSPFLFAGAVICLLHCGSSNDNDEKTFTTEGDSAVVSGIVGAWTATSASGKTYRMNLCEDTSVRNFGDTKLSCQTLHEVRGGGHGVNETVSPPDGCGGCTYDNSAYVTGVIDGDDLPSTIIFGQFGLTGGDSNSLAFPYQAQIGGAQRGDVLLTGEMPSADTLSLVRLVYVPTTAPDGGADDGGNSELDAGALDPGNLDSGDVDAGETDAEAVADAGIAAPVPSSSSVPRDPGSSITVPNLTFHRIGTVTCPTP